MDISYEGLEEVRRKDFEIRIENIIQQLIQLAKDYPDSSANFHIGTNGIYDEWTEILSTDRKDYDYCY